MAESAKDMPPIPEQFAIPDRLYRKWAKKKKSITPQQDFVRDFKDRMNEFFATVPGNREFTLKDAMKVWDALICTLTDYILTKEESVRIGPLGILCLTTHKPCTRPVVDTWNDGGKFKRHSKWAHLAAKRIVKLRNPHSFSVDRKGNVLNKEDAVQYIQDANVAKKLAVRDKG
jgi:hypothetical protein